MGWATKAINKQRSDLQSAYIQSQHANGIACPHCKTRIFTTVKHPKTGKDVCPACGKPIAK